MTESYEEVRRKLVERGYLQGRIERFLLRDLSSGARPRALSRTSLKAALLGAPLVGGWLSASTVAANRPLLGPRDALVLWIYFALLAGAALFTLDLAAAAIAAAWARRRGARPSDALRAGLIVAVPVLVYLIVLWARGRPGGGLGEDALFLGGAVATAAAVAWLAGVVSLAWIVGRTGDVPDRNRRFALLLFAVLVPVAAAFFLIPATAAGGSRARPPAAYSVVPRTQRLLVVGVDGLDGALVETLGDGGADRNLLGLFSRGALYPTRRPPAEPAEVWTTIATGMKADDHGVRSAGATRLPGVGAPIAVRSAPAAGDAALRFLLGSATVPASGVGRRVRAVWEIAGLTQPSAVVGWWASWPARGTEGDPPGGYVVSDRVLAKLLSAAAEDRDIAPASLFARLSQDFPAARTAWRASFDASFPEMTAEVRAFAWESFLIDSFAWRTSLRLLDDPSLATLVTYLPGLDILRTRLRSSSQAASAIDAYVRWLDRTIFAELAQITERRDDRVIIVADPGRSASDDAEGFVAVSGGGAIPACVGPVIGDLDIAPIALRLAGLPVSREMTGRAPERCFEGAPAPPSPIASWGRRGASVEAAVSDYDPEMVLRLKSLGYLK